MNEIVSGADVTDMPRRALLGSLPICLDGRLIDDDFTGVGHYANRLAQMLALGGADLWRLDSLSTLSGDVGRLGRLHRYARAMQPGVRRLERVQFAGETQFAARLTGRDLFREAYLYFKFYGRLLRLRSPGPSGIMHWTYPLPLYLEGWRNIYTVHDVIPITRPDLSPVRGRRLAALLQAIAKNADRLVTVSEAAKRDIVEYLNCPPDMVVSCHQVTDLGLGMDSARLSPSGPFLYCGAIEPRKNLVRLCRAYGASGSSRPLIIVGQDGWRAAEVRSEIGDIPGVQFRDFLPRDELVELIRGARALLFPSLAEGFGLPVAEAMALGVPVMTADIPALREVSGHAALFVDPLDVAAIAHAIGRLDSDLHLCRELSQRGLEQAVAYQAPAYLQRLQKLYAEVAGVPRKAVVGRK